MTRPLRYLALAALLAGCDGDPYPATGLRPEVPAGWSRWRGEPPMVPGTVVDAWRVPTTGEADGSLIVFRSPYLPRTTAAQLVEQRRFLLLNLPETELLDARVIDVGGIDVGGIDLGGVAAAFVELRAAGTGSALAPTGLGRPVATGGETTLIPTRRLWVAMPLDAARGTIEIVLHCPDGAIDRLRDAWAEILGSLRPAEHGGNP